MPNADELRREDDRRYDQLDRKVTDVKTDVRSIRDMLISEPQASPLGRALLREIDAGRRETNDIRLDFDAFARDEFKPLNDWWNQSKGIWKGVLGLATILGIIGAFFGIAAYFVK